MEVNRLFAMMVVRTSISGDAMSVYREAAQNQSQLQRIIQATLKIIYKLVCSKYAIGSFFRRNRVIKFCLWISFSIMQYALCTSTYSTSLPSLVNLSKALFHRICYEDENTNLSPFKEDKNIDVVTFHYIACPLRKCKGQFGYIANKLGQFNKELSEYCIPSSI